MIITFEKAVLFLVGVGSLVVGTMAALSGLALGSGMIAAGGAMVAAGCVMDAIQDLGTRLHQGQVNQEGLLTKLAKIDGQNQGA